MVKIPSWLGEELPDKERILLAIIQQLSTTLVLAPGAEKLRFDNGHGGEYVHFESPSYVEGLRRPLQPGDLVLCRSSGLHPWTVAWVVHVHGRDECTLRELGSTREARISNEGWERVVGLYEPQCWDGARFKFYLRVVKTMRILGQAHPDYVFAGLKFHADGRATVLISPRHYPLRSADYVGEWPPRFGVTFPWSERTSVRKLSELLTAGGVGTHDFKPEIVPYDPIYAGG